MVVPTIAATADTLKRVWLFRCATKGRCDIGPLWPVNRDPKGLFIFLALCYLSPDILVSFIFWFRLCAGLIRDNKEIIQ